MEVMDTSLDKFYKKIYEDGQSIPETVLAIIAFSVSTCFVHKFGQVLKALSLKALFS